MFPLLVPLAMAAAGVISAKMGAHARRKDAKASILQRSAESLGAPGSGGAVAGKRAANSIDAQEGSDLTNVFVNTLGQTLADKNNRLQQQGAAMTPLDQAAAKLPANSTQWHNEAANQFMPQPDDDPHNQYMRSFGR